SGPHHSLRHGRGCPRHLSAEEGSHHDRPRRAGGSGGARRGLVDPHLLVSARPAEPRGGPPRPGLEMGSHLVCPGPRGGPLLVARPPRARRRRRRSPAPPPHAPRPGPHAPPHRAAPPPGAPPPAAPP